MDANDIAVSVSHVSKDFRLPHERRNSLKEHALSFKKQTFEKFHALHDIDFDIKQGEFFGIVGRNGSGKSTLLKIIGGIYQPTSGSVTVNGTLTPFIELGIGFNAELTGRDNVFLNGAILGLTRKEIIQKYDEIVAFAELEKFMDQKLKNYSSGMQVRLAFSIAMQAHNNILLIDEVLAVGDERFQQKCLSIFNNMKKDKTKTIIFVSHDMQTVQRFCDRAVVIHDSNIIYSGSAQQAAIEYKRLNFPDMVEPSNSTSATGMGLNDKRAGSGIVRITDCIIRDAEGKRQNIIKSGESFSVQMHYDAKEPASKLVFGIAIKDAKSDSIIYGPNTQESDIFIDAKQGKGSVTLSVSNNIISPGVYNIEAGFFNESQTVGHDYVKLENAITFVGTERHGYVYVEPKWAIS